MQTKQNVNVKNRLIVATIILIVALVTVSFISLYQFKSQPYVSAQPRFIDVALSGPKKLSVNETGQYQAIVSNQDGSSLSFSWSVSPQDNKTLLVPDGTGCSLTFVESTQEPYLLSVSVKDLSVGNLGSASITVYDPYTSPNLYLNSFGASYSYLIESDGLGWYRAVNGQTGAISCSSINASYTFQVVTNALPSKVFVKAGIYLLSTKISLHSNMQLVGEERNSTILRVNVGVYDNVVEAVNASNIVVEDLTLDGNFPGNQPQGTRATVDETFQNCISFKNVKNSIIRNVNAINGAWNGIQITSANGVRSEFIIVDSCFAKDNQWHGIQIWSGNRILFDSCITDNGSFNASSITLEGGYDVTAKNCIINQLSNSLVGMDVSGTVERATVIGNVIIGAAMTVSGSYTTIEGNNIVNSRTYGIATVATNCVILGNIVRNPVSYAIDVLADGSIVSGNIVRGNQIHVNADNVSVTGNTVSNSSNGMTDLGTHNLIANNHVLGKGVGVGTGITLHENGGNSTVINNYVEAFATGIAVRSNNNVIRGNRIVSCTHGVWEGAVGMVAIVENNQLNEAVASPINITGVGSVIKWNIGYATENSVTATNTTATTIVYNHNLAVTPTHVQVTFTNASVYVVSIVTGTTQNTITFAPVTGVAPATVTATIQENCYPEYG